MNNDKFYIVILDIVEMTKSFDVKGFHTKFVSTPGIKAWWHYLSSMYIVKVHSGVSAFDISKLVRILAPNKHFFASEIILENYDGWLPKDAWDWIVQNK